MRTIGKVVVMEAKNRPVEAPKKKRPTNTTTKTKKKKEAE